jgi:hypothetical protein
MKKQLRVLVYGNAVVLLVVAIYFFVWPAGILIQALNDPGLRAGQVPRFTFGWHRSLSERFERWALSRVGSGRAATLSEHDVSGTEWPMFGSVFYLWATETLQETWEKDRPPMSESPAQYARGAIEAVADPNHATWVKNYWGGDYLKHENLFYRMLLISGLTSYQKLSGNPRYEALLRDQVESLASEIDESPVGLLDDYPGSCYPVDVIAAIAAIQRADSVLGTDHTAFARRAVRAFEGARLDPECQLPAYVVDSKTGEHLESARGVGISFMLIWAQELWPDTARQWYERYQEHFWQEGWLLAGFREFPGNGAGSKWLAFDVDAGPVLAGYGTAASAFGIGAARANGHFDHAYSLGAEALIASWPLPGGRLLVPSFLSNLSDAPLTGESGLLFSLTRLPRGKSTPAAGHLPLSVYLGLSGYLVVALACMSAAVVRVTRWEKGGLDRYSAARWQLSVWLILAGVGAAAVMMSWGLVGGLVFLSAQLLPLSR